MSLTSAQQKWYDKISRFVPSWWFAQSQDSPCYSVALFCAIAAMFSGLQDDVDDHFNSAFIGGATDPTLDTMGAEVSLTRGTGESDAAYRLRIQNFLQSTAAYAYLLAKINETLVTGVATLEETSQISFSDSDFYCDDPTSRMVDQLKTYDFFFVLIPQQGSDVRAAIISAIEANKAYGVSYDVLYLSAADTDPND